MRLPTSTEVHDLNASWPSHRVCLKAAGGIGVLMFGYGLFIGWCVWG